VGVDRSGHPSTERVSVPQAADHLGTTVDAIRKRVQHGTIPYEKDGDGRVWVLLDTGRPRQDSTGHRQDTGRSQSEHDALITEMRGRIEDLRLQLEAERQAHAEARRLLLSALEKIPPAIEAPTLPEARERRVSPGPVDAARDRGPQAATVERRAAAERQRWTDTITGGEGQETATERPWWRRIIG
jgi:hypothetical protein